MQINKKLLICLSVIFLAFSQLLANGKRNVGIMPFENLGNSKYDWVGFGFEYLLDNKLSNISALYVPDKSIILKSLRKNGFGQKKIDGEMVYRVGKETGINIAITGAYEVNGKNIEVFISYINCFTGATINSKKYSKRIRDIFSITNDIVSEFLNMTSISLTAQEQTIVNRKMTGSIKAFEYFCLGYLENEKSKRKLEVITSLFRKAIQKDNKFWEAYYNLGITYFNEKEYDKAQQQFSKIIQALPNFDKPFFGRGLIYYRQKKYKEARKDFERVAELNPNNFQAFFNLARINSALKQYKKAIKNLKKAEEINPDYADIFFERGNIWFNQNKWRMAIPEYKKCIELDPENFEARQKLGESYYRTQVYYSAENEFRTILESKPNDPLANFMLGITIYKRAVLSEIIAAFLEMFDKEAAAKARKGGTGSAAEKKQLYIQMADAFKKAQKARRNFIEATFNLALTYHEMGKLDSGLVYYKKTLGMNPNLLRAHVKMAHLYEDMGEKRLALEKYKDIVALDPGYFIAQPTLGPMHHYINIIDLVMQEIAEKIEKNPNDLKANTMLAKIYYAQGYRGKAANIYRKILTINPNNSEAKKMLAKLEK